MRLLLLLALPIVLSACVSEWGKDYATMQRSDPSAQSYDVQVPQPTLQRELDPSRSVSDMDCTKPVDPKGNLRCR